MDDAFVRAFESLHEAIYDENETKIERATLSILGLMRARFLTEGTKAKRAFIKQFRAEHPELVGSAYRADDVTMRQFLKDMMALLLAYIERLSDEIAMLKARNANREDRKKYVLGLVVWQIIRFFKTEYNNLLQSAKLSATRQIGDDNKLVPMKRWVARMDNKTCPICRALHGTVLPLDEPFMVNGQVVETDDGTYIYGYLPRLSAIAHPNDRCTIETFLMGGGDVR